MYLTFLKKNKACSQLFSQLYSLHPMAKWGWIHFTDFVPSHIDDVDISHTSPFSSINEVFVTDLKSTNDMYVP